MKFKKICVLFVSIASLLCGCKNNEDNRKNLLANSDYLLYGNISENHYFYTPTSEEFDGLYASGLNFIVLFSEEGCSACEQFAPIIKEYIKETHAFVVTIGGADEIKIKEDYKYTFFKDGNFKYPAVFVKEENNSIFTVDYASYMKTYNVFKRHMDSRYKISKYGTFDGKINAKSSIISEFTKIDFLPFGAFKTLIKPNLEVSQKTCLLSIKDYNRISLLSKDENGDFLETKSLEFNNETTQQDLVTYF